jgi:mono/diheme cytochrome c family protein
MSRLILILLALLAAAALLLALAAAEPARMENSEAAIAGRAVENGASLYRSYCSGCHGAAGGGIPGIAPPLNHPDYFQRRLVEVGYPGTLRSYTEAAIAAGRPVNQGQYSAIMPAWGQDYGGALRPDEIRDLASFILRWGDAFGATAGPAAPAPLSLPAPSAVERGKAVFFGPAGCLGCHGEPGSGGVSGPDMAGIARRAAGQVPGLSAEQAIRQSILAPGAWISSGCRSATCPDLMPRDYATRLRQADLDALVAYLLTLHEGGPEIAQPTASPPATASGLATATPVPTLRPPDGDPSAGEKLFVQECAPCHGERGQGAWASSLAPAFASIDPFQYVRAAMEQGIPGATMPAWGEAYGGRLNDQQLDDVAAYVAGWPQEMGAARSHPEAGPDRTPPAGLALLLLVASAAGGAVLLRLLDGAGSRSPDDHRRE